MKVWVATDRGGNQMIYDDKPIRDEQFKFWTSDNNECNCFPVSTKYKIEQDWEDEPIEMNIEDFPDVYDNLSDLYDKSYFMDR